MGEDPLDLKRNSNKLGEYQTSNKNKNKISILTFFIVASLAVYSQIYDSIFIKEVQAQEKQGIITWQIEDYMSFLCFNIEEEQEFSLAAKTNQRIFCTSEERSQKDSEKNKFEQELNSLVLGHPVEEMVPFIANYDKKVAGLIIGIAKKESNWGKRSPAKNGKTCYNYWGYKGAGTLGTAMGYGCFASPKEGVEVIGKRIEKLVKDGLDTPSEMIVWKCGSSCTGHNPDGVKKWISDVNIYYNKIVN